MNVHTHTPALVHQASAISRRRLLQGGLSVSALGALGNQARAEPANQPAPALPQGSVILFQGDSITDAGRKKEVLKANEFWSWDGIHPTAAGHALMAQSWRQAVGI